MSRLCSPVDIRYLEGSDCLREAKMTTMFFGPPVDVGSESRRAQIRFASGSAVDSRERRGLLNKGPPLPSTLRPLGRPRHHSI